MLIAIERRDIPVCDTISRNHPGVGVAFMPAVPLRFQLEPRELRLQAESGRLRYELSRENYRDSQSATTYAIRSYRETARLYESAPDTREDVVFNELA
ncbi:hypothetical protein [Caproicibacter sp.]|uniref:hypothetical protein n=1 Tax=Caproicibacter sp. TaxID=2814884 RepID=UPI0039899A77